jgi:hypothetical protein
VQRLFDIALEVAVMVAIVATFLWGGYAPKTEHIADKPVAASTCC